MTSSLWHDITTRARAAALKGQRLHLEIDHARAIAQNPELQALLGRLIAEETACAVQSLPPVRSPPTPIEPPQPEPCESALQVKSSGLNGEPSGSNTASPGMTGSLVQDAASAQALEQVQMLSRRAQHMRRSRRISLPAEGRKQPPRPKLLSHDC
jgi:hypothetical protein